MQIASGLVEYLREMDRQVEGWFSPADGLAIGECLRLQETEGVKGDVAEIGVHHGKSFLAIAIGARSGEVAYAIDIFDKQNLNIDKSGSGNLDKFLANCRKFPLRATVMPLAMSSLELARREKEFLTPLRFLSIDGGHTRDITRNDLEIADRILVEQGICCVDDIIHFDWPGVISGVIAFLSKSSIWDRPNLVPFALLPKKLYFCRPQLRALRQKQFREAFGAALVKADNEIGPCLVDSYNISFQKHVAACMETAQQPQ